MASGETSRDIVLIHGLWMTPLCWEGWVRRFADHGYNVINKGWPGIEGRSVQDIRRDPSLLKGLGLSEVVEHYEKIIHGLERPPIIMGHSFGGLITQLLLDRGLGSAGVAINSAQTKGVLRLPFSTIKAAWPALKHPAGVERIVEFSPDEFQYAFTISLSHEDSLRAYNRFYIPAPARPLIQVAFANFNPNAFSKVDYSSKKRAPLLFVSGGRDNIVPASINKENAFKYKTVSSTDYREFSERTHFTLGQTGWEEVADFCLRWANEQAIELESFEREAVH